MVNAGPMPSRGREARESRTWIGRGQERQPGNWPQPVPWGAGAARPSSVSAEPAVAVVVVVVLLVVGGSEALRGPLLPGSPSPRGEPALPPPRHSPPCAHQPESEFDFLGDGRVSVPFRPFTPAASGRDHPSLSRTLCCVVDPKASVLQTPPPALRGRWAHSCLGPVQCPYPASALKPELLAGTLGWQGVA